MSDAPYVTVTDDRIEYRASALGGCDMALLAARLEYDPVPVKADAPIMQVFAAGHRIEEEVLANRPVKDRQRQVELQITGRIFVVGHIDGIDQFDDYVVEVKSQNQEEWDRFKADHWDAGFFPKYKWQASAYMLATRKPLKLIRALRDADGNWTETEAVSHVDRPFYSLADIRERILRIEAAAATGVLTAECTPSFPCPYFYLHEEIDRELIDDEGLDIIAREYVETQRQENIVKMKKTATRRALREARDENKYRTSSGVKVTFYEANDPPRLDKELLEGFLEKHDRTLDEFMKQGRSERLRVTLPKEKDEPTSARDET